MSTTIHIHGPVTINITGGEISIAPAENDANCVVSEGTPREFVLDVALRDFGVHFTSVTQLIAGLAHALMADELKAMLADGLIGSRSGREAKDRIVRLLDRHADGLRGFGIVEASIWDGFPTTGNLLAVWRASE